MALPIGGKVCFDNEPIVMASLTLFCRVSLSKAFEVDR